MISVCRHSLLSHWRFKWSLEWGVATSIEILVIGDKWDQNNCFQNDWWTNRATSPVCINNIFSDQIYSIIEKLICMFESDRCEWLTSITVRSSEGSLELYLLAEAWKRGTCGFNGFPCSLSPLQSPYFTAWCWWSQKCQIWFSNHCVVISLF